MIINKLIFGALIRGQNLPLDAVLAILFIITTRFLIKKVWLLRYLTSLIGSIRADLILVTFFKTTFTHQMSMQGVILVKGDCLTGGHMVHLKTT